MDYKIVKYDLPMSIKGFVRCKFGTYTIVLNQNLSPSAQFDALVHEIHHIINGDLDSQEKVNLIEGRLSDGHQFNA